MLIQDIMHHPVVTIQATDSISAAFDQMHEHSIRHLPVMDAKDTLVGILTDRDIRYATSALTDKPVARNDAVYTVMSKPPITAGPRDPVEEAARTLRTERIGALPVVEGDALVGIITGTDLLDAVLRLTGLEKPGSRLAVALPDKPGQLAALTARVADEGLDIHSVLSYYEPSEDEMPASHLNVILRVDTMNVRPIAAALREEGFAVRWPLDKPAGT
ncbi:MAG: CBS and ACT domain-containing protein [Longimonas sp.]|uniref:CBS and ACT domain-containing protein n=1 Tax=Longimonas sp. TaxID=2039626 RepID=UPI003360753F